MRNILYAQLFFILIIAFVTSTKSYAFNVAKHISNVNGLTNNSVNCILEDAEHTIWIGTWDGLNAYNGREITTFRYSKNNPNSISNNVIRQIIECKGSLWIATDNGINRLDKLHKQGIERLMIPLPQFFQIFRFPIDLHHIANIDII